MGTKNRSRRNRTPEQQGEDFFQPVGVDGTITRVCTVFSKQWCIFLSISFITALVSFCSVMLTFVAVAEILDPQQTAVAVLIEILVISVIQCVGDAANIQAVAEILVGSEPTIASCFAEALHNLCALLASSFIVSVWFIFLPGACFAWILWDSGSLAAILWVALFYCTYVWFIVLLTYHVRSAIIVESNGPISGIVRSMQLVRENFCYTFCMLLIWAVTQFLINSLVTSLTNSNNQSNVSSENGSFQVDFTFGSAGDGIVSFVVGIFLSALGSILQTVIYFNNRVWTENLTAETARNELELEEPETNYETMETASSRRRKTRNEESEEEVV
mmetsp:Transcript_135652/g.201744  ORF Transcript_135652/g.201744 Transcript_135652/m.201744 type:complete len:331 (+) Transcript_135652:24-1016(+)